ncbi:MAG: DUF5615 family PIN-like protein [Candidatus Binatia bacterium]
MSAVKYLFDEDFNGRIVRGVRRRTSDLNTMTVQEADLSDASDPVVLEWAATEGRVVISHDHRTCGPMRKRGSMRDCRWLVLS